MNRDDYMAHTVSHQEFYCAVADAIGRESVENLVRTVASQQAIREALKTDEHLNNIPLAKWDAMHDYMLTLVKARNRSNGIMAVSWSAKSPLPVGAICWSLSETVCTLKAAAKRMAEATK